MNPYEHLLDEPEDLIAPDDPDMVPGPHRHGARQTANCVFHRVGPHVEHPGVGTPWRPDEHRA